MPVVSTTCLHFECRDVIGRLSYRIGIWVQFEQLGLQWFDRRGADSTRYVQSFNNLSAEVWSHATRPDATKHVLGISCHHPSAELQSGDVGLTVLLLVVVVFLNIIFCTHSN